MRALDADPLGYFVAQRARYVVLQQVREPFRIKALPGTRAALSECAERVPQLSPMRRDSGEGERLEKRFMRNVLERPFWLHTLFARYMGPTLEVYRLP